MDRLEETIATYNRNADDMAKYFRSVDTARTEDVEKAFDLCKNKKNPKVLEIGCGDGRDAKIILERTTDYFGFDPAQKFIEMARKNLPEGHFDVGDARTFNYPSNVDIVFAFASLLHLNKEELRSVLGEAHNSLNPGGIFYISLKKSEEYQEYTKKDKFGERLFYLYTPSLIKEMAKGYTCVFYKDGFITNGNTVWFEIALQKRQLADADD